MKRDGRHLERVGTLNTLTEPATVTLNQERVRYWVGVGAKPTDTVAALIEKQMPGYLKEIESSRSARIRASRAKRKARQAAAGGAKKAATPKAPAKKKSAAKAQPAA
jgi:small subunit ribosomal protein S16